MKILVLCTGNSCRSQMAEGFLRSFDPRLTVASAGTEPAAQVNPYAVRVMEEAGLDISSGKPETVDPYLDQAFDYVITVCDHANETCPVFTGKVGERLHIGFPDPAHATGTEEEILTVFRESRDDIRRRFREFFDEKVAPRLDVRGTRRRPDPQSRTKRGSREKAPGGPLRRMTALHWISIA